MHIDPQTTFKIVMILLICIYWLVQEIVKQEKVDAYNVPFYAPSMAEIDDEVSREGSFTIDQIQTFEVDISSGDAEQDGRIISMAIRAIQESMIRHHFGGEIIDTLFQIYTELLTESMGTEAAKSVQICVVLKRR